MYSALNNGESIVTPVASEQFNQLASFEKTRNSTLLVDSTLL